MPKPKSGPIAYVSVGSSIDPMANLDAAVAMLRESVNILAISTVYEGFTWTLATLCGVGLILLGNVLVLITPRKAAAPPPKRSPAT